MGDDTEEKLDNEVHCLEKINEIIDLCIDSQQYDYVDKILIIEKNATDEKATNLLELLKCKKKVLEKIKDSNNKRIFIDFGEVGEFPISNIGLPKDFKEYFHNFGTEQLCLTNDGNNELKKCWSRLFYAKRIRAELQRQNRKPWLDLYEDLTLYLENHVPILSSDKSRKAWGKTLFNYLMELSAVTRGEASLGYAERARSLIEDIITEDQKKVRDDHGTTYDRWIWYNLGVAYKHLSRHQDALGQVNIVLSKFWKSVNDRNAPNNSDESLEYLLNIYSAMMRRAELNLQLQLGYHALQILADRRSNIWLEHIRKGGGFFKKVVDNWYKRKELLIIDALLTLGEHEKASEKYFPHLYGRKKSGAKDRIFKDLTWDTANSQIPAYKESFNPPPSLLQVGLIEQTVSWYIEKSITLLQKLKNPWERVQGVSLKKQINELKTKLASVREHYWSWVEGNPFDEQIYFSKWAKLLGIASEIFRSLYRKRGIKSTKDLLESILGLYSEKSDCLPVPRRLRGKKYSIELENLRSDDLPDIVNGLNDFFTFMSDIKNGEEFKDKKEFRKLVNSCLGLAISGDAGFIKLRDEHFGLLDAEDEYEKEFGENQKIKALLRCHKRIQWLRKADSKDTCDQCLDGSSSILDKDAFRGILECNVMKGVEGKEEKELNNHDYESIMTFAEAEFTKSLHSRSIHSPVDTLHFFGLQRWNSLTPAQGKSVGGGYFIYHTDKVGVIDLGIVIDPGFDFVRNFFRNGFSIRDIDIVLISHAHADHLWDFESIVQLLHELNSKDKIKHRVNVIFTLGIYKRYEQHVIRNPELREYIDPFVIDIRKEIDPDFFKNIGKVKSEKDYKIKYCFKFINNTSPKERPEGPSTSLRRWTPALPEFTNLKPPNNTLKGKNNNNDRTDIEEIEVWPTFSYHEDYTDISDSYGFKIIMKYRDNNKVVLGYTGDTKWVGDDLYNIQCPSKGEICKMGGTSITPDPCWESVANQYKNCHVLLMHLGSLIDRKEDKKKRFNYYNVSSRCEELIRKENHPYLMGMIRFLRTLYSNGKKEYKRKYSANPVSKIMRLV
jgi:ribonuclease BN (tRNA processing enzyme)